VWLLVPLGSAAVAASAAPRLRDIRCMGGRDYSRLVLDVSAPVEYTLRPLRDGRVHVDLAGAQLTDSLPLAPCRPGGPLAQLRAVQTDRGVRLLLDVPQLARARAFPMPDPFRVVVDLEAAIATPTRVPATPTPVPSALARRRAAQPAPVPTGQRRMKIVIDPGHGGKDPGARGVGGIEEKDIVLAIAHRLREQLEALPAFEVALTRDTDVFLSLEERTARANAERADLFLSIHANASPNASSAGIETYYLNNTNDRATLRLAAMENGVASAAGTRRRDRDTAVLLSTLIQNYKVAESSAFAEHVQQGVVAAAAARWDGVRDLGVKQGPFYVLVGAGMPCVLVEVSFVTHPEEGRRLAQPAYQEALAAGLLRGIRAFASRQRLAETL
jgi:N-acetylmuramoyl-L-alanine amidase